MNFEHTDVTVVEMDIDRCNLKYAAGACNAGADIHAGVSQAGATANTIKLGAGASAVDDFYNGYAITLADGRRAIITNYVGATKEATVDRDWPINLLKRPQEFDHADWSTWGTGSVTADQSAGADGSITADRIEDQDADLRYDKHQSIAVPDDTSDYVLSLHVRAGSLDVVQLRTRFRYGVTPVDAVTYFDIGNESTLYTPGHASYGIKKIARDLYRVWAVVANNGMGNMTAEPHFAISASIADQGTMDWWGAQFDQSSVLRDYHNGGALAAALPDGVTYRVVEVGGECYNTYRTCQDKTNYELAGETLRFCTALAPVPAGEQIRPYVGQVAHAPTEIYLDTGLARRAKATVTLSDDICSDIEADQYHATRPAPAQGTYWTRFQARNPNAVGRWARIRQGYLVDGVWDWGAFTDEWYIIESLKPPGSNGAVPLVLKDLIKLADRRQAPEPSAGSLSADLAIAAVTIALGDGEGAGYDAAGWVAIGDEVIEYTAVAGDSLTGCIRGQFNTIADDAEQGDAVQQCKVWIDTPAWQVLRDLLVDAGIPLANIDTAEFEAEYDQWLGVGYEITVCIPEPEDISKHLAELPVQLGGFMWFDPETQKVRFNVLAPIAPDDPAVKTLTDEANVLEGSARLDLLDDLRTTLRGINFDLRRATSDRREAASYRATVIAVDLDAESINEGGARRSRMTNSRWFSGANAAAVNTQVVRRTAWYRDAPLKLEVRIDANDADIKLADQVDGTIAQVTGFDGVPMTIRAIVVKRQKVEGGVRLTLRATLFGARYAFIAPDGTGDYPASPEYLHIAPDENGFSDGTEAYVAF